MKCAKRCTRGLTISKTLIHLGELYMTVKLVEPCCMGPVLSQSDLCRELQKTDDDNSHDIKKLDDVSKECNALSSFLATISRLVNRYHAKVTR